MSVWGHIFAAIYDRMGAKSERAGMGAHRQALLAAATGDVLEIGGGTGANLPYYGEGISSLTLTEPERPMAKRLERRLAEQSREAMFLRAPAEDLPFNDASFDVVVSTLVLCTVDDQPRALREIRRVLRPGGKLLFIEHVRADQESLARKQDRMMPINLRIAHGCHCNRRTLNGIRDAGFTVTHVEHDTLKHVPTFLSPLVVGVAEVADPAAASLAGHAALSSDRGANR